MYTIKMESDKSLTTTIHTTIYQGDKHADTFLFLLPLKYGENHMADFKISLQYVLPNESHIIEQLWMTPIPYNKDYYQFSLSVPPCFTENFGDIKLWLTAQNVKDDIFFTTGTTAIEVLQHKITYDENKTR